MSNDWFYFAILSPFLWSIVILIDDNLVNKVYKNAYSGTITAGIFALLPVTSLFIIPIDYPSTIIVLLALLSGFLLITSFLFYFKALLVETPSVVTALWGLTPAIVPFLAYIFLHEVLTPNQYIGFLLVLTASFVISLSDVRKLKISKAFFFMIISSILYAISSIVQKYVYDYIDFWSGYMYISMGMGLGGLFFALSFKEGRSYLQNFNKKYKKYVYIFTISELLNIGGNLFNNLAVSKGPVSLVKVIEGIQPMFILIIAIILFPFAPKYFREGASGKIGKKLLLMMIILIGLYLIHQG